MKEFSVSSVVLGSLIGIIFGAANAYLGLKVGMTVSASIPAAVISMAVLRGIFRKGTILENNMVQTIGSAGESLAAGVIFTVPVFFFWKIDVDLSKIFILSAIGGLLGILFMIPLRRFLIVKEHGNLPYPEGKACAEVLLAGEKGGAKGKAVFLGLGIGALYKILMDKKAFGLWNESPGCNLPILDKAYIGCDAMPALLGVGFIIGPRIASYMLVGGILGWLVFIPLIAFIGSGLSNPLFPSTKLLISQMEPSDIWSNYIRYIGAGAVACGGIISLFKSIPVISESFKLGFKETFSRKGKSKKGNEHIESEKVPRTQKDLSMKLVMLLIVLTIILIAVAPQIPVGFVGALLIVVFSFFFVTVSSRLVGLVGSSSNPASGMTIAALLGTSLIFYLIGWTDISGMIAAITVGSIVCIAICLAGDISQDLKTGYLVGATPWLQQIGEIIGLLTSSIFIGLTLNILKPDIISGELLAPQANLMGMVVKGVLQHQLPWTFVICGMFTALIVEIFGIPSLPFAVGLYLPLSLSTPIMIGALIMFIINKFEKNDSKAAVDKGILFGSGLIAGEALVGILLAFMVTLTSSGWFSFLSSLNIGNEGEWMGSLKNLFSFLIFMTLVGYYFNYSRKKD
jgi:putative OPT family oligopeptide transporter